MKLRTDGGRRSPSGVIVAALVLGFAPFVLIVAAPAASAATAVVTNCNDSGIGSLRQAVAEAPAGASIAFSVPCPSSSPVSLVATIDITRDLTIDGPGSSSLVVSGNGAVDVFDVASGVTATISGLTIEKGSSPDGGGILSDGTLTVTDSNLSDNSAATAGGGIWNTGTLTVRGSTVSGNSAGYYGAGIYSGPGGTLTIASSIVSDNVVKDVDLEYPGYAFGGGIFAYGATSMTASTVSGNSIVGIGGGGDGGGIYSDGTLALTDSSVSGNTATVVSGLNSGNGGGGILNAGSLTVSDSSISGNTATIPGGGSGDGGGGILNAGMLVVSDSTLSGDNTDADGGAIANSSTVVVTNSTLSGNSALSDAGGGIFNQSGDLVRVAATIIANSTSGGDCSGTITDAGDNLDDDGSCGLAAGTDHSDTPAGLDPAGLQDNGGPTPTISLDPGSAAIAAVDDASLCSTADQRGTVRSTPCDIGAVELVLLTSGHHLPIDGAVRCDGRRSELLRVGDRRGVR